MRLDLSKSSDLIHEAIELHLRGFAVPVPLEMNANRHDAAYTLLSRLSGGRAHMARTRDLPFEEMARFSACCRNSVFEVLWQWTALSRVPCPGAEWLHKVHEMLVL